MVMIKMVKEHFQKLAQLHPQNMFIELNDDYETRKDLFEEL